MFGAEFGTADNVAFADWTLISVATPATGIDCHYCCNDVLLGAGVAAAGGGNVVGSIALPVSFADTETLKKRLKKKKKK